MGNDDPGICRHQRDDLSSAQERSDRGLNEIKSEYKDRPRAVFLFAGSRINPQQRYSA